MFNFYKLTFTLFILSCCLSLSAQCPDTDGDGICNAVDQCPNLDDQLIGQPCDDGKSCTTNDRWKTSCDCEGTPISDPDNDGFCGSEDFCANFDDDIDIDNDGIPYCQDDCVDANENGICDDVDTAPFTNKLKVHFSQKRGFYDNSLQVTLIPNRPNTSIRYTLGQDPDCPSSNSGTVYNGGPITISNSGDIQTLKVIGTNGGESTKVFTHTYLFNGLNAPTVVFSCSPYNEAPGKDETTISFEFIVPSGHPLKSIQEYAGTKTSSGGVQSGTSDKIFFRSAYGAGTMKEDLFSDNYYGVKPVNQFDQLFLRGDHSYGTRLNQLIAHDALRATEQISPAGRHVYFYEFGELEDIRHLQERPESGFMEAWTGIDKPNWEAYSGDQHSDLISRINNGDWEETKRLVNIESFGNFLLNQWVANCWDFWDTRNYRTAGPTDLDAADGKDLRWHYFNWDWDLAFPSERTSWKHSAFQSPEDILGDIRENEEFDLRFADIIQCAMYDNGPLTADQYNERVLARHNELQDLLYPGDPFDVRYDITEVTDYIPVRVDWLKDELTDNNYYPDLRAVRYSKNEGTLTAGEQLTLSNPNGKGSIYYTLDGSDVRSEAGVLNPDAIKYTSPITLSSGVQDIFARVYDPSASTLIDRWSATCGSRTYLVDQNYSDIIINEIHYSPLGSGQGQNAIEGASYEFVELKNIGNAPVNLKGSRFSKGINFDIENSLILQPGGFAVFAEDAAVFQATYGFAPDGQYSGKLANEGEKINLKDPLGYFIDQVEYNQKDPWDEAVDSTGYTLELLHGTFDNQDPLSWFRSDNLGGTPGAENSRTCANPGAGIVINEINYNSSDAVDAGDWVELHNPTTNAVDLSGWTLYDSGDSFVLPQGTVLAPEAYVVLVVNAGDFSAAFPNINDSKIIGELPFKLSSKGERLSLFDSNKCLADYVIYDDKAPWPLAPDGEGPTLSLLDPVLDNALPQSWESSMIMNASFVNGSPSVSNVCTPGQTCDDGDICTFNDLFDNDCNCVGTLDTADSDNDGVCNTADICPAFDDTLIGTPCDDGNDCTAGETWDTNCGCSGGVQGDIDNDGICDALDNCNGNLVGTTCEDGDPCTTGETYDINCNCTGGVPLDSDNDGVCDEIDICDGLDDNLIGTVCDDGNPATEFDIYSADACGCAGIITAAEVCSKISDDDDDAEESVGSGRVSLSSSDLDMTNSYIIGLRFQNINIPNGATITNAAIQFGADETDAAATTITIKAEATDDAAPFSTETKSISTKTTTAATATWTPPAWTERGEVSPAQKTVDLSEVIQEIVSRPGFAAGNAITIIIESEESRVAESHNSSEELAAELCISFSTGACQIGYPCDDGNPNTINDITQADCSCAGSVAIVDNDNDGIPADEDCDDNDANAPLAAGTACNDGDASTYDDIEDGNCNCAGIPCLAAGVSCNDGDASTYDDIEDGNCNCAGIPCPAAGVSCNDGNPNTTNDVEDGNCNCAGTPTIVCPPAGTACDDGDPNTTNDAEDGDCNCAGTPVVTSNTLNITGINYNPLVTDPLDEEDFEFILVTNYGTTAMSVSGDSIKGIDFVFPIGTDIAAGETVMITKDLSSYPTLGNFRRFDGVGGKLKNSGENLTFKKADNTVINDLTYDDATPWPLAADGQGSYLSLKQPGLDNTIGTNWEALPLPVLFDNCPLAGTACDDGDANTIDDVADGNCGCAGTIVCPVAGTACDDGDANTTNDVEDGNCNCAGIPVLAGNTLNITGINYNPLVTAPLDEEDFEFILVTNFGTTAKSVSGDSIKGIDFVFPVGTELAAGETVMVTKDLANYPTLSSFRRFDGVGGKLKNGGENLTFQKADNTIINDLTYDDAAPWPLAADGQGSYLVLKQAGLDNSVATNWEAIPLPPVEGCPAAGTVCDDGNANTTNDIEDGNCNCAGTPTIVCPPAGTACNDSDDSTFNDVEDGNCNCAGTQCPLVGSPCDDGNANTINDVEDGNCNCAGTPIIVCPPAGTACDDGNANTINDVEDGNCNCAGTPVITVDSCQVILENDFEAGFGQWIDGGSDVTRKSSATDANSGSYSIRIRDNSGAASSMSLEGLAISPTGATFISFSYLPESMEPGEDFFLEIGTAGTYTSIASWVSGTDFINGVREAVRVELSAFTSESSIDVRLRCDGSSNFDIIYIDDVVIENCDASGPPLCIPGATCSDGDPCTEGETLDANCNCVGGEDVDVDDDGYCAFEDPDDLDPCIPDNEECGDCTPGAFCTDGDDCTEGETFDADCNCVGGVVVDQDGDGYCAAEDQNDLDPCIPDNTGCNNDPCVLFNEESFESGLGIWNDGGNDVAVGVYGDGAVSGIRALRIRDNSGVRSSLTSNELDFATATSLEVAFNFNAISMEPGESFILEVSADGGITFTETKTWVSDTDFINEVPNTATETIPAALLSANTVVRFRCDASSNFDIIYLDDIKLTICDSGTTGRIVDSSSTGLVTFGGAVDNDTFTLEEQISATEMKIDMFPNPTTGFITLKTNDNNASASIIDSNGKQLSQLSLNVANDITHLNAGMYLVVIRSQKETKILKFVKL